MRRKNRDLQVLRNIMLLLGVYIIGALPSMIYMLSGVEFLFSVGVISVSLMVTIEKLLSMFIDREIRKTVKKAFAPCRPAVTPARVMVQ